MFLNRSYNHCQQLSHNPSGIPTGLSVKHWAALQGCAHTETHTPTHSQLGAPSTDLEALLYLQKHLLRSLRPGRLSTPSTLPKCVLWCLQHLPSARP